MFSQAPQAALEEARHGDLGPAEINGNLADLPEINGAPATFFRGRLVDLPDGQCTLYEEDIAYRDGNLYKPGPRHRLWMRDTEWKYEKRF